MMVWSHLESDIMECEVKWALGSINMIKVSGSDEITAELFQILKDNAVKVLHSICQQIWKMQQWSQDWKRSVFTPIPKKGNTKVPHNCTHLTHQQINLQNSPSQVSTVNCEIPDVQAGFRKGRGTRDQIAKSVRSLKKQESSRKTCTSTLLTMLKPLTVWVTTTFGIFFKRLESHTTWPASWEICMQVRKQQLELDMEQQTGSS